jgi:hypothetical protein
MNFSMKWPPRAAGARRLIAAVLVLATATGVALWLFLVDGAPAEVANLAPHRAAYALSLDGPSAAGSIVDARGVMVTEWGETCEAWTAEQRIVLELQNVEDEGLVTDTGFTSWEAKDGLSYRFSLKTIRNGETTEEYQGDAKLNGRGRTGEATFTVPANQKIALPEGTVFPMVHSARLVKAAESGDQRLSLVVFDGATKEGMTEINAFIGAPKQPAPEDAAEPLTNRRSWGVRLAFFNVGALALEPQYELGMRMFDNGVAGDQIMDFGDFKVRAKLQKLEALPRPKC